jgi:hypothetical protein
MYYKISLILEHIDGIIRTKIESIVAYMDSWEPPSTSELKEKDLSSENREGNEEEKGDEKKEKEDNKEKMKERQ